MATFCEKTGIVFDGAVFSGVNNFIVRHPLANANFVKQNIKDLVAKARAHELSNAECAGMFITLLRNAKLFANNMLPHADNIVQLNDTLQTFVRDYLPLCTILAEHGDEIATQRKLQNTSPAFSYISLITEPKQYKFPFLKYVREACDPYIAHITQSVSQPASVNAELVMVGDFIYSRDEAYDARLRFVADEIVRLWRRNAEAARKRISRAYGAALRESVINEKQYNILRDLLRKDCELPHNVQEKAFTIAQNNNAPDFAGALQAHIEIAKEMQNLFAGL